MTYRDDHEALLQRAAALQRQVDELREQLAARGTPVVEPPADDLASGWHDDADEPSFTDQLLADLDVARARDEAVPRAPLPPPIPDDAIAVGSPDLLETIADRLRGIGSGLHAVDVLTKHLADPNGVLDVDVLRAIALLERAGSRGS